LLKILIIEAELHFSDDSVTNKLFGRQKIFSLNEMVRAYLEVLSYNEANRPRDRIHFHGVAKLFSRSIRLNFPFLGEKFNIHDEKSSIDGQFISDAAAHPFFNACTAARELCIYLKKMSFYRIFPKSTTNLICEHDTDLKHVKIYEISEGILVTVLDKTSILALPKYVLYFEDNEHVRRKLPLNILLPAVATFLSGFSKVQSTSRFQHPFFPPKDPTKEIRVKHRLTTCQSSLYIESILTKF
jgi:hypothetical protein